MGQAGSAERRAGRRLRRRRAPLSCACGPPALPPADLLDVNSAGAELLMTLGLPRRTAQALVAHRLAIGGFRRLEDVAVVSGIGAERLDRIRPEICLRKGPAASDDGSRTISLDSVGSTESSRPFVDVNSANVFQLQGVHGLNQELAANIVYRREKKGPFKSLDDLIKVKGMDKIRLSTVKTQLILESPSRHRYDLSLDGTIDSPTLTVDEQLKMLLNDRPVANGKLSNGVKKNGATSEIVPNGRSNPPPSIKRQRSSVNGFSPKSVDDIFDLLSLLSRRPFIDDEFKYARSNRRAVRVATWNLHRLNAEKANNPGFREVSCRTILENRLSIVGVQDVLEEEALKIICDELNKPMLLRIVEWKTNSKKWKYHFIKGISKNVGFIYENLNNSINIQVQNLNIKFPENQDSTINYGCADFHVNGSHICILNVQLTQVNLEYSKALLCEKVDSILSENKMLIIIGDFYSSEHVKDLATCYKSVIEPETNTIVELDDGPILPDGGNTILIAGDEACRFTGVAGVVRKGLCHLAIPHGWTWGGPSSPFCPVWAEFYID